MTSVNGTMNETQSLALSLAQLLADRGNLKAAEEAIAALHQRSGLTAGGLDLLARIQILRGNRNEAERLWNEAYRLDSANAGPK
jgi:predicted Zn-dependent protease